MDPYTATVHELSLCQAVADLVERTLAGLEDDRRLRTVHVRAGALTQVVPSTFVSCWELLVERTSLAGSAVQVETVPVTLVCRCGATTTLAGTDLLLACGTCGAYDVEVRTGEELLVTALDLVPLAAASAEEA